MDRMVHAAINGSYVTLDNKNAGIQGEANSTTLRLTFGPEWDIYTKKITWVDARGRNPVALLLQPSVVDTELFETPIPAEPLAWPGRCNFVIEGYAEGDPDKIMLSARATLYVMANPMTDAPIDPVEPTPDQITQLQANIDKILPEVTEVTNAALTEIEDVQDAISVWEPWSASKAYIGLNKVVQGGASYIAVADSVGVDPSTDDGTYWLLIADHGAKGDTGATGAQGAQGVKGDKGDTGDKGEKGDTGAQGIQGVKGDPGDKGDKGDTGAKGDKGDTGATGDAFVYSDFTPEQLAGLKGEKGDTGAQGSKGDKGDPGEQGAKGDKGDQGDPGAKGDKGDQGVQGLKGDQGDQGIQGLKGDKGDPGDAGLQGDKGDPGAKGADGLTTSVTLNGTTHTQVNGNIALPALIAEPETAGAAGDVLTLTEAGEAWQKPQGGIPEDFNAVQVLETIVGLNVEATQTAAANQWFSVSINNYGQGAAVAQNTNLAAYTEDGGKTWVETTMPSSQQWYGVSINNSGHGAAVAFDTNLAAYTEDGGKTWVGITMPSSQQWSCVSVNDLGQGVAAGLASMVAAYSEDGGKTWSEAEMWSLDLKDVSMNNNGQGIATALDSNAAAYTENGGKTWVEITMPSSQSWYGVSINDVGQGAAVASETNLAAYTEDGGKTWVETTMPSSQFWFGVSINNNGRGFAVAAGMNPLADTAAYTEDGGKTWVEITMPSSQAWTCVSVNDLGQGASMGYSSTDSAHIEFNVNSARLGDRNGNYIGKVGKEQATQAADEATAIAQSAGNPGMLYYWEG